MTIVASSGPRYSLRLFVCGHTHRSAASIRNLRRVCDEHLPGRFELEVIDIRQQPELAKEAQILASPTLVKESPLPRHRLIGDLSDETAVLAGLGIDETTQDPAGSKKGKPKGR